MTRIIQLIPALALGALLTGCGTDSSSGDSLGSGSSTGGGSSASTAPTPGVTVQGASSDRPAFSLRLTDAPIDGVVAVVVQFTEVRVRSTDGAWTSYVFESPASIDLLSLQGSKTADLLVNMPLDDGDYDEIRLFVDEAPMATYVDLGSAGVKELEIKNGSKKGIKVSGEFSVSESRKASFVLDFDLRKSVKLKKGKYELKPKLRLVEQFSSGHIRGMVDPAKLTLAAGCSDDDVDTFNAVYVFKGHGAKVRDIDLSKKKPKGPLSTTLIKYDAATQSYMYEAAFLPAGEYTVAYTCNADLEDLDKDKDNLRFFGVRNATVVLNNIEFL